MKVLHLVTGLARGGAEGMLYRLLAPLRERGVESAVASLTPNGFYSGKIESLGIPVFDLGMRPGMPSPLGLLRLRGVVKRVDPSIVHSWMYHAALAALVAVPRRPQVVAVRHALHDLEGERFLTRHVITGLAHLTSRARSVVYCSAAARLQHEAIGYDARRSIVVPNGFDCDAYRPMPQERAAVRAEWGLSRESFVAGHLGRYHATKDHALLLEAFAAASRECDAYLVLAGAGIAEDNAALASLIARHGLERRIRLLGERNDVPRLLNGFDAVVSSSRSEAFPNTLGEAMASGVPCVATDVGDSAYIVGDAGLVVPPRDVRALAAAILDIARMPREQRVALGVKARSRIVEHFSLTRVADAYVALYGAVDRARPQSRGAN